MKSGFLICFILLNTIGNAQKRQEVPRVASFELVNSVNYLPSVRSRNESYKFQSKRIKHKYGESKHVWRFRWYSKKRRFGPNKKQVLKAVDYIVNNRNKDIFFLPLTARDKDSLISRVKITTYDGLPMYSCNHDDLMKYIGSSDTIKIELKEFKTEYSKTLDAMYTVIDGAPFTISLKLELNTNDSINYKYVGNLCDYVEDTTVPDFLMFHHIHKDFNLFRHTGMDRYFGDENFYDIILRYITYKENKIDRSNYYRIPLKP